MIRFVEIHGEYLDGKKTFAFYNTVNDHFLSMGGGQTFEDYEDFKLCYSVSCGYDQERLEALIPEEWKNTFICINNPMCSTQCDLCKKAAIK